MITPDATVAPERVDSTSREVGTPSFDAENTPRGFPLPLPVRIPASKASRIFERSFLATRVSTGIPEEASIFFETLMSFTRSLGFSSRLPYARLESAEIGSEGTSAVQSASDASVASYGRPREPAPLTEIFSTAS